MEKSELFIFYVVFLQGLRLRGECVSTVCEDEEDTGPLPDPEIRFSFPLPDAEADDGLRISREVGCGAKHRLGLECRNKVDQHLVVAVRGLNEYLGLIQLRGPLLDLPDSLLPLIGLCREITAEGKALAIEPRCHEGKHQG